MCCADEKPTPGRAGSAEWSNAVASAATLGRSRVQFPGLRSRSEPRPRAASVLGLVAGSRLRQTCTVCRSRRFCDLGTEFGTFQAPFRMHSRIKMPDLGVGFGASRTHPGWVRDAFTVQNARSRGRIRGVPDPSRMGSGHIHGSKCPISESDSARPGPILDGFGTHSRFKMSDFGVEFETFSSS